MNDAYSTHEGGIFRIGTGRAAMELELTGEGRFLLKSLLFHDTGKEYLQRGPVPQDEFSVTIDGREIRGLTGGFTLQNVSTRTLSQGELETVISLARGPLAVRRHYVAYPGLPVIQSWT